MAEDQEKTTIEAGDDTKKKEEWTMTIKETKEQLATMYLDFLDQKKEEGNTVVLGGLINLNPYKKDAKEYLLSDAATQEKTDIWNTFLKNVKKKGIENFSGWKIVEYDKIKLNKMKE